jgi:hypothetical protein
MVSRHDKPGRLQPEAVKEYVCRLELAVPGTLAQVAGDYERRRPEGWKKFFQRLDLLEVGKTAEVDIG